MKRETKKKKMKTCIVVGDGFINDTGHGTYMATLNRDGARHRRCFKDLQTAQRWLENIDNELRPLSGPESLDAQLALRELPEGCTLLEAVRFYAKHLEQKHKSPMLSAAIKEFLEVRGLTAKKRTMTGYSRHLKRLMDFTKDVRVGDITRNTVEKCILGMKASYRNVALRHISPFFSWCVKKEYITENICDKVERAKHVEAPIGIFTVEEAESLLRKVVEKEVRMVPYVAVGLFAGIRPDELLRLKPENFKGEYIMLAGDITKTANARTVPICPNLKAWLAKYPWQGYPPNMNHVLTRVRSLHGAPWPQDGMRHSYATYAYEETKDAASVAFTMGHTGGVNTFFTHYRALALPGDGKRYFSIMP